MTGEEYLKLVGLKEKTINERLKESYGHFDISEYISLPDLFSQIAEESSELSQACLKMNRKINGRNPVSEKITDKDLKDNIKEEIADVINCIFHLAYDFNFDFNGIDDIIKSKNQRWKNRLEKNKERSENEQN